jgi:hypothetical protein
MLEIPALGRPRQEDHEFKARLDLKKFLLGLGGMVQVVESQPEALSSIPSTATATTPPNKQTIPP